MHLAAEGAPAEAAAAAYGGTRSLTPAGFDAALAEISSWPGYAATSLVALPGLARQLGLGQLLYKDERSRFEKLASRGNPQFMRFYVGMSF